MFFENNLKNKKKTRDPQKWPTIGSPLTAWEPLDRLAIRYYQQQKNHNGVSNASLVQWHLQYMTTAFAVRYIKVRRRAAHSQTHLENKTLLVTFEPGETVLVDCLSAHWTMSIRLKWQPKTGLVRRHTVVAVSHRFAVAFAHSRTHTHYLHWRQQL